MNLPLPDVQSTGLATPALLSMTDAKQARYRRVATYKFDAPDASMPFSRRLAEREGWSQAYTNDVIEEYRRFTFLAVSMDHVATPSKSIDAAWHLHLEYTREYWDVFCAQVLQTRLHHSPGTGAPDEAATYERLYAQTLDSYRRVFGTEPPESIWPKPRSTDVVNATPEFELEDETCLIPRGPTGRTQWTDRPHRHRITWVAGLATPIATYATYAYAGDFNVFNYDGPRFMHFYEVLCVSVLLLVFCIHKLTYRLRPWGAYTEHAAQHGADRGLTPEEVAVLTGDGARMAQIATLRLMNVGAIHLFTDHKRTSYVEVRSTTTTETDTGRFTAEWEWLRRRPGSRAVYHTFRAHLMKQRAAMIDELATRGWVWAKQGMRATQFANRLLASLVLGTGVVKIVVGLSRGRPVESLVTTMIFFVIAYYFFMTARFVGLGRAGLTRGAREALDSMRAQLSPDESEPDRLLLKTALLGVNALNGTLWSTYTKALVAGLAATSAGKAGGTDVFTTNVIGSCSSSSSCNSSSCSSSSCGGCSSSN